MFKYWDFNKGLNIITPVAQDGYLTEAQQYAQETDLSRRVRDWEERILPVLSREVNCNTLIILDMANPSDSLLAD